ncbi:efflux RND transporter periplasmic adaptor subunit [Methylobacillus caricis]|uniref:efflux RND transporter periplasmic adaptor subunit n=1 Tax=Methylobacillus caricis TaxID=1971611 RepID=UPI001CFFEFD9|nr:efflux RND transporter periplasmic adaptor subunit [Methylobacillus caricis]MCB5188854.1 efflux RND transporter periplasmic adaptor subunit [Methylobacillus caricis]
MIKKSALIKSFPRDASPASNQQMAVSRPQRPYTLWLVSLAIPALVACQKPAPETPPPRPALVMKVSIADDINHGHWLTGEVRPRYESAQGFRIAGKIVQRYVEVGNHVRKGQALARLDAEDNNLSLASAQAALHAAEAELALAAADSKRQRQLFEQRFISAAALDSVETRLKSSHAQVQQAKAQENVASNQARYTMLTAERDGVVTSITAEPGQVVSAGQTIARIAVPEILEVTIAIPESRMQNRLTGDSAVIRLWANRDKAYQGRIREIAPAADPATRTFQTQVSLLDPDEHVQIGMTAGVRLDDNQHGFLLPTTAVSQQNGQAEIWVLDASNQVHPQAVSIGGYSEQGVSILSGLIGGETIVITGIHTLTDGQVVTPVNAEVNR